MVIKTAFPRATEANEMTRINRDVAAQNRDAAMTDFDFEALSEVGITTKTGVHLFEQVPILTRIAPYTRNPAQCEAVETV